ncbi:MAG: SDR family oxidoreductase, partial [Patescibacteria group bacterium]
KSHILLTSRLYPLMQKQQSGHIVFINSSAGKEGYKNHTLYSATKFGLSGFAKSLRLEAKEYNIKVTSIYPGGVKTQLYRNLKTPVDSTVYMDPKHVAHAVVYLTEAQGYCPDELVLSRMSK